jgi:hypothetical protein
MVPKREKGSQAIVHLIAISLTYADTKKPQEGRREKREQIDGNGQAGKQATPAAAEQ